MMRQNIATTYRQQEMIYGLSNNTILKYTKALFLAKDKRISQERLELWIWFAGHYPWICVKIVSPGQFYYKVEML